MTLKREQIRELAAFEDTNACAVSFYFQPATPRNKAHKEDTILIKDLAREAMRGLQEKTPLEQTRQEKTRQDCAQADLERIVRLSDGFRSNGTHAKAVFACAAKNVWYEYDLPPQLPATQLFVDRRFHLKPVAQLLGAFPRLGIILADRQRARVFDFRLGELTERESLVANSRKSRAAELTGYDAGRAQHRAEDEARHHFKAVADSIKESLQSGVFEKWILGCHDILCSQLEPYLHSYASQRLLGHFHADLSRITAEEIRSQAERILDVSQDYRRQDLVRQALSESRGQARGVTGLRRVLRSLEMGEVQTLLIGEKFLGHAVECSACGHLDPHLVSHCPACGRVTHEVVDVGEAILPRVIRRDIELFYVKDDPEFDKVGNIAALLRFRSDQSSNVQSISDLSAKQAVSERRAYPGRLRRFAGR